MTADSRTLRCAHCGEEFAPDEAAWIEVIGPSTALYRCPQCGHFERSLPPRSSGSDETGDEDTRRGFLRAAGALGIGTVGLAGVADEAGASEWPECNTDSGSIGAGADDCSPPGIGEDEPVPVRVSPNVEFIENRTEDALCNALAAGCSVYTIASLATPIPGDEVAVLAACGLGGGTCYVLRELREMYGPVDFYRLFRAKEDVGELTDGDYLVVPA